MRYKRLRGMKEITVTYCQRFRDIGSKTSDLGRPEKAVSKLHTCIFQIGQRDFFYYKALTF